MKKVCKMEKSVHESSPNTKFDIQLKTNVTKMSPGFFNTEK